MRAVVIGAGVVGSCVARELALCGDAVTVVDADAPGAGTSSTSFAWVNASSKEPEAYFRLNHAGMDAHRRLAASGDAAPWLEVGGNLEWSVSAEHTAELDRRAVAMRTRGYPAEMLEPTGAHDLEPDLRLPDATERIAFYPDEGHCFPQLLIARALGEARDRGTRVLARHRVVEWESGPAGVRVELTPTSEEGAGTVLEADVLVCCAGRWTEELLAPAGIEVPMLGPQRSESMTLGYLFTTAPVPVRLSRIITTERLNVRPAGGGRLLVQALDLDPDGPVDVIPSDELTATLAERLGALLPEGIRIDFDRVDLGRRSVPADGVTVCGRSTDESVYVAATHSGVTLAPLLGELIAGELHGRESELLADFRPTRFAARRWQPVPASARRPGEQ